MSRVERSGRYTLVTAASRAFGLMMLALPVAALQDPSLIVNVTLLGAIWLGAVFVEGLPRVEPLVALVVEAGLASYVVALSLTHSLALLPALTIACFVSGLVCGLAGLVQVLVVESAVITTAILVMQDMPLTMATFGNVGSWLVAGLGLGLAAAFFHGTRTPESPTATSYRDARALLLELRDLSGDLVAGLDPLAIAQSVVDVAREELPLSGAVAYAEGPSGYLPLVEGDVSDLGADNTSVLDEVFRSGQPVLDGPWVGIPLLTDAGVVGAVTAALLPAARRDAVALHETLAHLMASLRPMALQLDTALVFSSLRDIATAEERRRLARELHDGVAQDLASFGYLIDELTATAEADGVPDLAQQSERLRSELTRVVAELRRSVFQLRNEANDERSLGESVRSLAAHISSRSGIQVEVQLEEGSRRLRPDIEAELLRIAQEGLNNAVRHARAHRIEVDVRVHAPNAEVRVRDDGTGLQPGRDDSHGLRIMRERARRIGARLTLENRADHPGTELRVELKSARSSRPHAREEHAS